MHNNRIFICIPWFHPAFRAGGPIQSVYNLVQHLYDRYRFYIFTGNADLDGTFISGVPLNTWVPFNSGTRVFYCGKENRRRSLLNQIKSVNPDKVFVIGLFNWHFNIVPLLYSPIPVIVSARGMLYSGALAQKSAKKRIFLRLFKLLQLPQRHVFHATGVQEKEEILKTLGNNTRVFIAGNFPREMPYSEKIKDKEILSLITIALISPMKNHLKVIQGLQNVQSRVNYHVYGPVKDAAYWDECLAAAAKLPPHINFEYHGEIAPGLIPETLLKADVFMMPSVSENYGHSIMEALFAGIPVITSNRVPWLDLEKAKAGINIDAEPRLIARAVEYFAKMDNDEFSAWKICARNYAETHTDVAGIAAAHIQMFETENI